MPSFIVMNPSTGKAVRSWTFAGTPRVEYTKEPEFAMKLPSEESAKRTIASIKKNFNVTGLVPMKAEFSTVVKFL